jgi:CspA family cold shock protein
VETGTVRFYNQEKGYGFISPDSGGAEVFVHVSTVELAGLASLQPGDRVRYETIADREGRNAAVGLSRLDPVG